MKKVLTILGAGALSFSLFGCSGQDTANVASTTANKVETVNDTSTTANVVENFDLEYVTEGPILEQFEKSVEQTIKNDNLYIRGNVSILLFEKGYLHGSVVLGYEPDESFTDEQVNQKFLLFTYDWLYKNSKLDEVHLQMDRKDIHSHYYVSVDRKKFGEWLGFDIEDEQEWQKINIDNIDSSKFFERFGDISPAHEGSF